MQGLGPYANLIKKTEKDIKEMAKKVNDLCGMLIYLTPCCVISIIYICKLLHFTGNRLEPNVHSFLAWNVDNMN